VKPERVCEISLKFQLSNTITTQPHSFKIITRFSIYFPFFSPLPRIIIISFFKKVCGNKYSRLKENYLQGKERTPNDPSPPFKEKEKGGEGRFKTWWPMEGSMLGGQWNVPSLVANEMFQAWWPMEGEGKTPFHLFHFPLNKLYINLQFFPLTLRFYFTMVLSHHSHLSFLFFDL